ncbi:MAG: DCC1-like thiol-disulfide oxidoreductase family protein [Ilumatobacter sp.]
MQPLQRLPREEQGSVHGHDAPPRHATVVRHLTVLYDSQCSVCRRARSWVDGQLTLVPLSFVPAGSNEAAARFPHLDHGSTLRDITVLDDEGRFYQGDRAWIMVLWAVASTRALALDVATGRKQRLFGSVKGAAELARKVTAGAATPPPPLVPPLPFAGWNAPGADAQDASEAAAGCVSDTCHR